MEWIECKIYTTSQGVEPVYGMLTECGINAIQVQDDEDMRLFLNNNRMSWDYVDDSLINSNNTEVILTFYVNALSEGLEAISSVKEGIKRLPSLIINSDFEEEVLNLGSLRLELENVNDEQWLNNWKKYYKPFNVGEKILIKPVWENVENADNRIIFNINPGYVFGTGLHQTTQLCIEQLEKYVNPQKSLLDLGCGSGILSIISLLLGAKSAFAVDIDSSAVDVAYENANLNNINKGKYTVVAGNVLEDKELIKTITNDNTKYNIVVANIVADVIIALSPLVTTLIEIDGVFITSGIIKERLEEVYSALNENGFIIENTIFKDDWVCVVSKPA